MDGESSMKVLDRENSLILDHNKSIKGLEDFIGTVGYFADNLDDVKNYDKGTLKDIILSSCLPYISTTGSRYTYFIPKAIFEEIEPSIETFTLTEIVDKAKSEGSSIDFQNNKFNLSTDGHMIWDNTHKNWLDHRDYAKLVASKTVFVITNVEI